MGVLPTAAFSGGGVGDGKGVVIVKVAALFVVKVVDVGDQSVRRSSHERIL